MSLKNGPTFVNNKVQYSNRASICALDPMTPDKEQVSASKPKVRINSGLRALNNESFTQIMGGSISMTPVKQPLRY